MKVNNGRFPNRLLVGNIIEDEYDRQFIIDQLGLSHPNREIAKTKLLYMFP
jgi:hypothetical protein